jgi:hypothetical protein
MLGFKRRIEQRASKTEENLLGELVALYHLLHDKGTSFLGWRDGDYPVTMHL